MARKVKVQLTKGYEPPICRYCGRPLKPIYITVWVNAEKAIPGGVLYDAAPPVVGESYRSYQGKIIASQEIGSVIPQDRQFRIWLGHWGYGDRFCGPTCAARWALRQP